MEKLNSEAGTSEAARDLPSGSPPQLRTISINLPKLSGKELRKCCYSRAKGNICYGSSCIRDMVLTDIQHDCVFEYVLESLCEKREYEDTSTPYFGQKVDGPESGPPVDPWAIPVSPPEDIVEKQVITGVPHSSYIKQCGACSGAGRLICTMCFANGNIICRSCNGRRHHDKKCLTCNDGGMETCMTCTGGGKIACNACNGQGKVMHFKTLIVTWRPEYENVISNPGKLPKELLPKVKAKEILREQGKMVQPLNVMPPKEINEASVLLIKRHLAFRTERIILQRHILRVVPFTKAKYVWRDEEGEFFVYGYEKKVYFHKYPDACCWCCCC